MLSIKYNKEKTQLINMIKNLIRVLIMDLLKIEVRLSWEKYGKSIFVIKFLRDDLRGLSSD